MLYTGYHLFFIFITVIFSLFLDIHLSGTQALSSVLKPLGGLNGMLCYLTFSIEETIHEK